MTAYDIARGLATQSNRGTADPYIICLQEKVTVAVADGHGDRTEYYSSDFERSYKSIEDFKEKACVGYDDDEVEEMVDNLQKYEVKDTWEDRNWFFTDAGYEEHLKLNRHNYKGEIRSYLCHAFRNPEMKALFDHLKSLIQTPPVDLA